MDTQRYLNSFKKGVLSCKKKSFWLVALLVCACSPLYAAQVFEATYIQDFESTAEFGLPTGWTEENQSDYDDGSTLAKSDQLAGWTVLTFDNLSVIGADRVNTPGVVSGKSVYAESDNRTGIQRQYLYTSAFDLRKLTSVQMQFDSNYVQNQDNIAFAEYTLQGNLKNDDEKKIWLPIFYWVKDDEVAAANGDVTTLMTNNGLNKDGADDQPADDPYLSYITKDIANIDFAANIQGRKDDDKINSKKKESYELPKAAGQQYVQIRFFLGGGSSWYWGIDNFAIGTMKEGELPKNPDAPTLSVSPANPTIVDNTVTLTASAYKSQIGTEFKTATWQVATDQAFTTLAFSGATTSASQLSFPIPSSKIPAGITLYARVTYNDKNDQTATSTPIEFTYSMSAKSKVVFSENFESVEDGKLPTGWTCIDASDLSGPEPLVNMTGWTVLPWNTFTTLGDSDKYTSVRAIVGGNKSCLANSDNYSPYEEAHLLTPKINLTGKKNVYLAFSSNYVQNQDNIGVLEYTIDGATVDETGYPSETGTWLPISYLICSKSLVANPDTGNMDPEGTLAGAAEGIGKTYGDYAFALPKMSATDLAPYISLRTDDDSVEGKRFEKYLLPKADGQAKLQIRWMNMGTNSWFWGIDDVQVWAEDPTTDINEWSLF